MNARQIKHDARLIVKDALDNLSQWELCDSLDGDFKQYLSYYLGTVFSIMPSGKFYMPWACSNIDSCPRCRGTGQGKLIPCQICNGTGKRIKESWMNFPEFKDGQEFTCNVCNGLGLVHDTCQFCNGLGSREAYEDSIKQDALEHYADKYNAWIESGEGDPCDLFICKSIESEEFDQ